MEGTKIILQPRKKARIEIIPLIDVIFFLLATFVLFTLSLNRIQSLPINLPKASILATPSDEKPDIVTLQVSDAGILYWNREQIQIEELVPRLVQYKSQSKDPKILIASDEKAHFGAAMSVLDEIRKLAIEKVSVETRLRPTGK